MNYILNTSLMVSWWLKKFSMANDFLLRFLVWFDLFPVGQLAVNFSPILSLEKFVTRFFHKVFLIFYEGTYKKRKKNAFNKGMTD